MIKYIVFIGMLCLFSCSKEQKQTEEEFKIYNLEQQGWKSKSKIKTYSDLQYRATMVPLQYYLLKELGNQNLKQIDSLYELHKEERIIEIEFEHLDKDDVFKEKYTQRSYESTVKYAAFTIQKDFKVVTQSGDTIPSAGVILERNFKVAPFKRLLVHFGGVPANENVQLLYNDELLGNGLIKFDFTETPLQL